MGKKKLFNDGWYFLKMGLDAKAEDAAALAEKFQAVDVPHDWLIYDAKNLYEDSIGFYRKRFVNEVDTSSGKKVLIRFDGIYMDCKVYINGHMLKEWKYGYSTFDVDASSALVMGENEILVMVRHQAPNSRWYSGAGIYRNVWIRECDETFLAPDGTYVVSRPCEGGFLLKAETEVQGKAAGEAEVEYRLFYQGREIQNLGRYKAAETDKADARQAAGMASVCKKIENPLLWDIENPALYELRVSLYKGEGQEKIEEEAVTIGFRSMEFVPDQGFLLNGRIVKINGVCEHHDFGCLGAAFSAAALERKFLKLRKMGVNGIRTSHNMPAPELMELADRMGFLVVSEAFDMWEMSKTEYDYARFFVQWAERDVASWVRRDRNHPSLMLWSIGNEIYDTHAGEHGQEITRRLIEYVKCHDPEENGRVTIGSNYMAWENAQKCADLVKIAGYNYGERYYDAHHKKYPDWILYGSETASVVQSRGIYHFPLSQSLLSDEDEQCSALGNATTSWGAKSVERCITDHRDAKYNFGQFIWTGFDYIGEPTPYQTKNSYFGHLDTAGFPKDSYYTFQAEWTDVKDKPMVHLFPYWDFNEGQMIDVRASTNASLVELFVNGESYGKREIDHEKGLKLLGEWQVPYRKGNIRAVAYDEEGKVVAEETRYSFKDAVEITVEAEDIRGKVLKANGEDLCFLTIGVRDEEGHPVENAMNYVTVKVEGAGRLLGLDNGDSTDYDQYKSNTRKLFNGKLLAVIATVLEAGEIHVTVTGEGLTPAAITLNATEAEVRPGITFSENCSGEQRNGDFSFKNRIPVRKVELSGAETRVLSKENPQTVVEARIFPENASDRELVWQVVNDAGIQIPFATVEEIEAEGNLHRARVSAFGDGKFRLRCMSKSSSSKIKIISQLEFSAEGMGYLYTNPYEFVSAGLYQEAIGSLGNGNEKGIATAPDGESGAVFTNLDFGEYGSDTITIPVFALSDEEYPIEIWCGKPGEEGSELLLTGIYQKPSIWGVYQEVTWQLKRRLKGVVTLSLLLRNKVHIKGFCFRKEEKAFGRLYGAECSRIYGDRFEVGEQAVTGIGNNVVMEFDNMDFGQKGAESLTICGKTDLAVNTIHVLFTPEEGEAKRQVVEFTGSTEDTYTQQSFLVEGIKGRGKVEFIFLPGSKFDFLKFWFA